MDDPITKRPVEVQAQEFAPVVEEQKIEQHSEEWVNFKYPPIPYN